jgi:nucleolar protein 6
VAKNDKLHDERARDREKRAELEMKQGERKEKKEARMKKGNKKDGGENAPEESSEADTFGMNPARLAMMQRPAPPTHRQRY